MCVGFSAFRLSPWPLWLLLFLTIAPGCARARAKSLPSSPPLEVPAPPPRIVVPVVFEAEAPPPEPGPPPDEPSRPAAPAAAPARPRPAGPVEPPKAAEEPPRSAPVAPPAVTLQTTPAAEQEEVERAIRATMSRATAVLSKVDYRALNADARMQYDTAKRFIEQADDAIRMKNLPFAKNLADKAAALAVQLGGQ